MLLADSALDGDEQVQQQDAVRHAGPADGTEIKGLEGS
jgi:hypothetical protein